MTKRRLYTLAGGVAVLASISWWRLSGEGPQLPPKPGEFRSHSSTASGSSGDRQNISAFSGRTMGTTYTVKFVPPRAKMAGIPEAAVERALLAVNASMSTYDPKSEISVLNRTNIETPMPLSEMFAAVFTVAQSVHEATEGAFDPTVGPLVSAYGFGAREVKTAPSEEELTRLEKLVGMVHLGFDAKQRTLRKLREGVELDFGGIAKGFGVDEATRALEALGIDAYMVEVGGEIRVRGTKKDGSPWVLALEEPVAGRRRIHGTLSLPKAGAALATSGDYRNFRELDGKVVSHTFDPRTKKPVHRRTASASVVRPTAVEADALATAMLVLEPEKALMIANKRGYAVYLLAHKKGGGFQSYASREFSALDMHRP